VKKKPEVLARHFEGRAQLAKLLEKAGSLVAPDEVAEGFARAQTDGLEPADVFPALFDEEPHFDSPKEAAALYSNLLGLWDLVASGTKVDLTAPPPREKLPKQKPIDPPPPYQGEPDAAWVEAAWKSLESESEGEVTKLWHAFENRQDALLLWLEQEATAAELSDEAWGAVRDGAFQLFAILHRGQAKGWPKVKSNQLGRSEVALPAALQTFADDLCFDLETDEALELGEAEAKALRRLITTSAQALWAAKT
jgi:hypothetical protein